MIVPMDDWAAPATTSGRTPPRRVAPRGRGPTAAVGGWRRCSRTLGRRRSSSAREPTTAETWAALVELAERLAAPVFQESFGAGPGFPQDHPLFAGFLPADRTRLRERLAPFDVVLVRRRAGLPPVPVDRRGPRRPRCASPS